jgi:AraC-like DNA-binding protein
MAASLSHPKRKVINWKTVLNCVKAQCTLKETAAILDVCENTLRERCLEENDVSLLEYVETSRIAGLASLRRRLFRMAQGDNFPALKFALGNYLKMYEKNELVVAAKYVQYTDEEREMLRRLAMEKAKAELEATEQKAIEQAVIVPNPDELDDWEKV